MFNALKTKSSTGVILSKLVRYESSPALGQVSHHPDKNEFSLGIGDEKAVLQYKKIGPSAIDLEHTIVPKVLEGRGIGKLLAEAALEHVINHNLHVKISCNYVQKYLEKNPNPRILELLMK